MDFITQIKADYLVYVGTIGLLLGLLFVLFYLLRRILRLLRIISGHKDPSPKIRHSLRNLIFILLWTSILGMVMFLGFFLRAYHVFTLEKPVAEIVVQKTDTTKTSQITLIQFISPDSQLSRQFSITGDQWMLEGDILKWDNWLNFAGLHTRYRLTRIRSRYIQTKDEIREEPTVYSLVEDEDHPLWRYLYQYGQRLPFISTVYGNAVLQASEKDNYYLIYVSTSGFVVREKTKKTPGPKLKAQDPSGIII